MANGMQSTINSIAEVREQAAFSDGAEAAFKALREIYDMPMEERYFLFGGAGLPNIVHEQTPEYIFDVLNHKDELLAQRLQIGDVINGRFGHNIIVTWVDKDQIHFDGIWDDGPNRGRVLSNRTLKDLEAQKDTSYDKQDVYCLKVDKYEWE